MAHIVHRLDYGGLENGLINLLNGLPVERFRHAVICLAGFSDFRQ
ncbi:MAG: sugar transferase, partial [Gammaproteobacteria bacterium]|nr:sugar transferase [Gammaproteobacteria bacterium]